MPNANNLEITINIINFLPKVDKLIYLDSPGILKEYKINKTQLKTIFIIGHFEGSVMKEIWKKLNITKGNLSIILDLLVSIDYIKCERQLDDRRKVRVFLTNSGKQIHKKLISEVNAQFNRRLSKLSNSEVSSFRKTIEYLDNITTKLLSE